MIVRKFRLMSRIRFAGRGRQCLLAVSRSVARLGAHGAEPLRRYAERVALRFPPLGLLISTLRDCSMQFFEVQIGFTGKTSRSERGSLNCVYARRSQYIRDRSFYRRQSRGSRLV